MGRKAKDLKGKVFGKLTAINRGENVESDLGYTKTQWWCACNCNNTILVRTSSLQSGATRSCGCLVKEVAISRAQKRKDILSVMSQEDAEKMKILDEDFNKWRKE